MKPLDKFLRWWRVKKALSALPAQVYATFDVGCDDGFLLRKMEGRSTWLDGCDPRLSILPISKSSTLLKGYFPAVVSEYEPSYRYDAIFAVAVLEHLTEDDLSKSGEAISRLLSDGGRFIATVPHPLVDVIVHVLFKLRFMEAKTLEEHHGFNPNDLRRIFSGHLKLVRHTRFQLGLNNLFVFEKRSGGAAVGA